MSEVQRPAWVVGHITVKNVEKWAQYRAQVPGTLAKWGAELVFRGERRAVLGGEHRHTDTVTLKFPSTEAALGWHASAAYQALIALRHEAADVDLIVFES
jgi:uncharacterized protein (DUF1330 family)